MTAWWRKRLRRQSVQHEPPLHEAEPWQEQAYELRRSRHAAQSSVVGGRFGPDKIRGENRHGGGSDALARRHRRPVSAARRGRGGGPLWLLVHRRWPDIAGKADDSSR